MQVTVFCLISAVACVPTALVTNNPSVLTCLFFFGVGFGCAPALYAQIGNEAGPHEQGRVQGFNYAVMTLAWAAAPYVYWYMYTEEIRGTNDDETHPHDHKTSLFWWLSCGVLTLAALVMMLHVGISGGSKLVINAIPPAEPRSSA